jgi:hypothetical protein
MPEKIKKPVALKSMKIAVFSEAKGTYVSFVCGPLGPGKKDIFVMSRKNIAAVRSEAKQLYWEKSKEEFSPVAFGSCRLEKGTLYIRTEGGGKGAATVVAAMARKYFKLHHKLPLVWTRVVKEDEPIINDTFLDDKADETIELVSDMELDKVLAAADAEFGDAVTDSDGNETLDESDSGSEAGGSSVGDRSDSDVEDDHKEEAASAPKLDAKLAADIKTQLEEIVKTLLAVAAAIGLKIDGSEADIIAKLFGWLERMLAGLSPAEQAVAAANWLSRLQLAISSSTQAMRDTTVVAGRKASRDDETSGEGDEPKEDADADDSKLIPGVDLNDITTEGLNEDEIVKAVFDKAVELLGDVSAEYDMSSASDQEARKFVGANKAKWQGGDDIASVIRLMFTILERSKFENRESLVAFLKLQPLDTSETSRSPEIPEWIAEWKAAHASAVEQVERVKDAAEKALKEEDETMSVAKLGGTWKYVDDIFVQVDVTEVESELRDVMNATNDNRVSAIEKASATLQTNLSWLFGNDIVSLVDSAPFDGAQATVGETLGGSLQGLVEKLSRLQAEAA